MKNKIAFLIVLLLLLVSIFFNVYLYTSLNNRIDKKDDEIKELEKKYVDANTELEEKDREIQRFSKEVEQKEALVDLKPFDIKKLFDDKETFTVVISQAGCSHCKGYVPVLESALNEVGKSAYIIELEKLNTSEVEEVKKYFNYSGTPTTFYVKNGEIQQDLTRAGSDLKATIIEKLNKLYN